MSHIAYEVDGEETISLPSEHDEEEEEEEDDLAYRENVAVACLRGTVVTVLLLTSMLVSYGVYRTSSRAQSSDFKSHFDDASAKIVDSVDKSLLTKLRAIDSLAVDLSSFAGSSETSSNWPSVVLPEFEKHGTGVRALADAASVMVLPIVDNTHREAYEAYTASHQDWAQTERISPVQAYVTTSRALAGIPEHIFDLNGTVNGPGPFLPVWQTSPVTDQVVQWVNFDLASSDKFGGGLKSVQTTAKAVVEQVSNMDVSPVVGESMDWFVDAVLDQSTAYHAEPVSPILYPVVDGEDSVAAVVSVLVYWRFFLSQVLPPNVKGVVVVVSNSFGQTFTYQVDGEAATFLGAGDAHDSAFSDWVVQTTVSVPDAETVELDSEFCAYNMLIYPSQTMQDQYVTNRPTFLTTMTVLVFLLAYAVFFVYDCLVEQRQKVVLERALQSTAIVSSLFPQQVRDRLFRGEEEPTAERAEEEAPAADFAPMIEPAKMRLKNFLTDDAAGDQNGAKPIADLFPNCTVLFADISGFTAWSSLRDPAQVFTLLEAVYQAFDKIARRRDVFKVETVGDSYVAVTGLPDPQDEHAIIMARFARDCRDRMNDVTRKLELTLGPDTGDLRMRFGLHSGPVTAGVLRGEKSRFQLFGDTVNTAARMESTGERDKIQCSASTAELLRYHGKAHWVKPRDKLVHAKGKGELQTYWIEVNASSQYGARRFSNASQESMQSMDSGNAPPGNSVIWGAQSDEIPEEVTQRMRHQRLIDYNTDVLCQHIKQIIARRKVLEIVGKAPDGEPPVIHPPSTEKSTVMEECSEVIKLPSFDATAYSARVDPESIELDKKVVAQLKRYVSIIAAMYRNNPFHNFEHASHVTMSVNKLLQRVVAAENVNKRVRRESLKTGGAQEKIASALHNFTYGITSDPLTQFAIVFSALIHDVDHWGVSNQQLIKEHAPMAKLYDNKSIAEQNSVDKAWDLLMDAEEYGDLHRVIFPTGDEYNRFRQVVVNIVVATDIFDKDQSELRRLRWEKAFEEKEEGAEPDPDENDRKATIVIEHIMQASDVAHTMQHWHVYQRWNRRLFDELYTAWKAGRMGADPTSFWYKGELKFFEGYVIPLAKKLKDCGVFGVASDECYNYAINNMKEWEAKGQMIVAELVSNYNQREEEEKQRESQQSGTPTSGGGGGRKKKPRMTRRRSLWTNGG